MRPLEDMLRGRSVLMFDLDGTLLDSIGVWNDVDETLIGALAGAHPPREEIRRFREECLSRFHGREEPYLCYCAALREKYGIALEARQIHQRRYTISQTYLTERVDYKPGADRFLHAVRKAGYTLLLTTTGRRRSLDIYRTRNRNIAAKAPLGEMFHRVYTCEDVQNIKPDPEIYRRALADGDFPPAACLVFEDSLVGVQAARAAGLETAAVYDGNADADREAINALAQWQVPDYPTLMAALGMDKETAG